MTRVSVIIPCYNDGKYLPEAVASAQAQTHADIEIIVVDDHSTDPQLHETYKRLREQSVRVIQTPQGKKGLPAARNTGIEAASGEFILTLDADDYIAPAYVSKAAEILDKDPNIGICYCKARFFGHKHGMWKLPPYSLMEMLCGNVIFATALFRKSDWVRVGGYDETLITAYEDYAFWLRILMLKRKVAQINEVLFYYRIKLDSLTVRMIKENNIERALQEVFYSCEKIYSDNTFLLLQELRKLRKEKDSTTCLLSWKIFRHIFRIEYLMRSFIKRINGMR